MQRGKLIRRQDAIDALEQLWDMSTVDGITASTVLKQIKTDIKNLPSAEPEIIKCKDCKHLFEDNKCPLRTWWTHTEDDFCSYAERRADE